MPGSMETARGHGGATARAAGRGSAGKPVLAAAAVVAVVGAGVVAYAYLPGEEPASPRGVAAASTPSGATPTPSGATPTPGTASRKASPRARAVTSGPACGAGLDRVWANWPMPNPRTPGLPNPARYTARGDGTVRDHVTCLVWQRVPAPKTYTFTQAKTYCAGLRLAGGGWHLPTRIELTSIIDVTRANPAIDPAAFPGTPPGFFWTSSPWAYRKEPLRAWIVNFYEGLAGNAAHQSGAFKARCVRSPSGAGRPAYRITGGQVTDPATGLTWQRATAPGTVSAPAATAYCARLRLGGHTSWRLPSIKELATTVDESRGGPAVDQAAFPGTVGKGWYWSSSRSHPQPAKRWGLSYDDGYTDYRNITTGHARCVRG
ncbi:DUF1566 domain-containing protein [Nonomuraea sp. MG754425]|uniref:Lcl C-terminal domain-containing protein n=1 Tax=Nonomuraea sp. MG754425 TaxID=2570319 RepID=UPI001F31A3D7|nr:DUF1566 domain-containing protein [Nonomuraea sp. MG754425]MCF6466867.1 DUF1566 domain-containing protein [Nonomuraea sp. MG754425]